MSAPSKENREREYVSKIIGLMNNHKVGGAKSTRIMKLIGKQRFRKPGQLVNKWDLLWLSTQLNLPDLVDKMIRCGGVNINKQFGQRKYTCLHLAASYGYRPIIQLFLQNNADYEVKNSHAKTAVQISVDELTRKFLRKEIEKKKNLYSKFSRLESDFGTLENERKQLEIEKMELIEKCEKLVEELKKANQKIVEKEGEIVRLEDYTKKLKERGLQDQSMLEEFENNILTSSSVLTAGEKLEIGLQMMKKMVARNKKLQEQLRKTETEVGVKQVTIIDVQRQLRKVKEKLTLTDSRYCKEIRKKDFEKSKLKKKLMELVEDQKNMKERFESLEKRNKLYQKSQKESVGVIAHLERVLKNTKGEVKKKEEKIQKLYEVIEGQNVKTDGVLTNFKRLQDEVKRHEKDDILGRSPQKIEIFKQKRRIKKISKQLEFADNEKGLATTKIRKMENVLVGKQNQISLLLKKVDEKTVLGTKKTVSLRRQLDVHKKEIESLMLKNQLLEKEKKKFIRERETERNRHNLLLKKEKRINLRWEKMLLKMDKEKRIEDDRSRMEEERAKSTFEERRMMRRRKKLALIGTDKGKHKEYKDRMDQENEKRNEQSVMFIRKKVSRVFTENEDFKHKIKKKNEEMKLMQEKMSDFEAQANHTKQKLEEELGKLKTEIKEKELKIEKLLIKVDRQYKRSRQKKQREKTLELKKEHDAVDRLLLRSNRRFLTKNNLTPRRKKSVRRKRKF